MALMMHLSRRAGSPRARQDGFTLVELLVALAIFSVTAVALLKLQGENARLTTAVEEKFLAGIIAENQLVEVLTRPNPPDLGIRQGEAAMAGRQWRWTQTVSATPGALMLRIDIDAGLADAKQVLAARTAFRPPRETAP